MLTTNRILSQIDPWGMWNELNKEFNSQMGAFLSSPILPPETPVNLWAKEDQAIVQAEVPGREPGDIDVSVHRHLLVIEVKSGQQEQSDEARQGRRERNNAAITRQVQLPFEIDPERVEAICERGVLTITLHRHESTLPSKVQVKAH